MQKIKQDIWLLKVVIFFGKEKRVHSVSLDIVFSNTNKYINLNVS